MALVVSYHFLRQLGTRATFIHYELSPLRVLSLRINIRQGCDLFLYQYIVLCGIVINIEINLEDRISDNPFTETSTVFYIVTY